MLSKQGANVISSLEAPRYSQIFNELWQDALSPIANDFFHPYPSFHSYQIINSPLLFEKKVGTIFLKDGVLGLVPFLSKILKNKEKIANTFALPIAMAPIIPRELKDFFIFYQYISANPSQNTNLKKIMLFLGPLSPHTSFEILMKDLILQKDQLNEILVIRQELNDKAYQKITHTPLDISIFNENCNSIKNSLSAISFQVMTLSQATPLNLSEYMLLNTNHFNYFCSEDYLNYLYYFRTGRTAINSTSPSPDSFIQTATLPLIRNLNIQFFSYQGPLAIDDFSLAFLLNSIIPNLEEIPRLTEYFNTKTQVINAKLLDSLFQINAKHSGNLT